MELWVKYLTQPIHLFHPTFLQNSLKLSKNHLHPIAYSWIGIFGSIQCHLKIIHYRQKLLDKRLIGK